MSPVSSVKPAAKLTVEPKKLKPMTPSHSSPNSFAPMPPPVLAKTPKKMLSTMAATTAMTSTTGSSTSSQTSPASSAAASAAPPSV